MYVKITKLISMSIILQYLSIISVQFLTKQSDLEFSESHDCVQSNTRNSKHVMGCAHVSHFRIHFLDSVRL